jgi:hypothetical protein
MWERFLLRQGFRNTVRGGRVTGFQFKITIPYYRGLWVSAAFQDFAVRVDGVVYPKDKIALKIGDRTYRLAEVDQAYDDFWYFRDPATVLIEQPGGLTDGLHKVEVGMVYERSYGTKETPPEGYNFPFSAGFNLPPAPRGPDPVFSGMTKCALEMVLVV